ncbi:MAG: 50S ribosomal protein L11 methyltransferase [Christensenellales bacterium]
MDMIQITVETTADGIEIVGAALLAAGFQHLEIIEDRQSIQRFLMDVSDTWDYVEDGEAVLAGRCPAVRVYAGNEGERTRILERIAWLARQDIGIDLGALSVCEKLVRDEDWADNWKKHYHAIPIGERLVIVPEWERLPDKHKGRIPLYINPGIAFGTGQHETTAMCLEAVEAMDLAGKKVLDAGCGSGILSVAALLLGARRATAVDIDPAAAKSAGENAAKNRVAERYQVFAGNLIADEALARKLGGNYDLVLANIVADVIVSLAPKFGIWLKEGGRLIASGIIHDRMDEVTAALDAWGFMLENRAVRGEWNALTLRKNG